jgi:hypothetical protein
MVIQLSSLFVLENLQLNPVYFYAMTSTCNACLNPVRNTALIQSGEALQFTEETYIIFPLASNL